MHQYAVMWGLGCFYCRGENRFALGKACVTSEKMFDCVACMQHFDWPEITQQTQN